jgi:two-component sensor histidine kinase
VRILDEINQDLQKKRALSEKLMRELNHRVKNNLQIISSLFNLQAHSTENRETKMALGEARNRINSIAILHQKLYQGELLFEVEIQSYLQSLCEYMHMSDASPQTMEIHVNVAPYILSIQDTIYLGLVVNELVTNSLKYARQDGKHLRIQVVLESADGLLHLTVKDNGQGFAVSEKEIRKGFGLELVETIADHYDGKLSAGVVVGGGYQTSLALQMENRGFSSSRR